MGRRYCNFVEFNLLMGFDKMCSVKLLFGGAASPEVRQAYKQFIGAVVELIDREVPSEEFREVALAVYHLFGGEEEASDRNIAEKR